MPPTETLYKCVDTKGVVHYTDDPTRNPACPAYRPGSPYPTIDYTDESMREAQKKLLELMMRSAKH
ncbi:MAG: DUF4124 domain-containing protein [Azoarcus sp.]|nr:DUF4124 domain-containing protein [Azoarcus sp.]